MLEGLDALSIARFHDAKLVDPGWPNAAPPSMLSGAWRWVDANHRYNGLLWSEARRAGSACCGFPARIPGSGPDRHGRAVQVLAQRAGLQQVGQPVDANRRCAVLSTMCR